VSLGQVALDGTKIRANASKHKAMSHERMLKSERQLEAEMRALLRKAELIDAQEDGQYGKGRRGDELPEELQRRSSRLEWIRKAKAELEAEAAGLDLSAVALAAEIDPLAMPTRTLPSDAIGNPKSSAQRNFTDPHSHILKGHNGWLQGYNCQAAVDGDHQVIVAIGVSNQASDAVHLLPMLKRIQANTGQQPGALIADAGYCSTANLEACKERELEAYISTSRQQHGHRPGWTASCAQFKARRSTPCAKRSWSRCLVRSKAPGALIASGYEGWRR